MKQVSISQNDFILFVDLLKILKKGVISQKDVVNDISFSQSFLSKRVQNYYMYENQIKDIQ